MKDLFELFKLSLSEKKRLISALIFTVFVAFFTFVFVNLVQPIIDNMLQFAPQTSVEKNRWVNLIFETFNVRQEQLEYFIPILLVVVIFGKGLFTFLSSYFMKSVGIRIVRNMRDDLYENLLHQSSSYFDNTATGKIMTRLTSDVDKLQEAVSGSMKDFLQEVFTLLALLAFVFYTDWHLALVSFVIAPLAVIPLATFSKYLKKRGLQNQVKMSHIFDLLHEMITGNKIVKAFTMEKFEMKKFNQATGDFLKTNLKLAWIGSLSSPFMEFLGGIVGAFILIVGVSRIGQGAISAGDFTAFIVAMFYSFTPIKRLSRANVVIQQGLASYERIKEVQKAQVQIVDKPDASPLPKVKGRVEFVDVSFSYNENRPVLYDVSFEIIASEMVALVGLSGSGKTTIVNLLSRFYEPTAGKILIDGMDIQDVTLSSLRSQIGLVTQELILFNDTVRNNIAYGLEDIHMDEIISTAKAAEAHEFINQLPYGYDTFIGEKGSLLSSGQRQRLAIARALLKDPPILILDEATSALDSESERLIQIALSNVLKGRTSIVIAHRMSTISNADKILVIDRGTVAERGNHQQLIHQDGIYKKLYELQFPEEKEIEN